MRVKVSTGILILAVTLAVAASGCVSLPDSTAQAPDLPTQTPLPSPEEDTPSTPEATEAAAPAQDVIFTTYQHATNVFSISIPENWSVRDDASDERLLVTLEPPLGFASRVIVDVTYESGLTLDELAALREGYLNSYYLANENYSEINRADLPDGRLQVTLLYNNPAGASGRETVYLSQIGPYFAALRAFTSDNEVAALGDLIEQVAESFVLNPTARWGEAALEVEPEALVVEGLNGWFDAEGNYRVMGRILNEWQDDVGFLTVKASVCDPDGVVLDDNSVILVNDVVPQGGVAPFEVRFGPVAAGEPRPCLLEPSAEPAERLELETYNAFEVTHTATLEGGEGEAAEGTEGEEEGAVQETGLNIGGTVFNAGEQAAHLIDIIIAIYDGPEGNVIGYAVTTTDAPELAPGEASLFSRTFTARELGAGLETSGNWVYELWVQGTPLDEEPLSGIPTPTPTPSVAG